MSGRDRARDGSVSGDTDAGAVGSGVWTDAASSLRSETRAVQSRENNFEFSSGRVTPVPSRAFITRFSAIAIVLVVHGAKRFVLTTRIL